LKKLFVIALFLMMFLPTAYANPTEDNYNGFYGLFCELTEFTVSDFGETVSKTQANKITKLLFDEEPFKNKDILRKDLITYLAGKCSQDTALAPLAFKDAGLLDKNLRKDYSVLNANAKIYYDGDFLSPNMALCYDYFIGCLSMFEDEILNNLEITKSEGTVATVSLNKKTLSIKLLMLYNAISIDFENMESKNVYKNGFFAPYSRNIANGDRVIIYYRKDGKGIYVKFANQYFDSYRKLGEEYTLYKGNVYYIDTDFAVVKDVYEFDGYEYNEYKDSIYGEFKTDKATLFNYNFSPTNYEYINENLLDKPVFIICDKEGNAKYLNLSE